MLAHRPIRRRDALAATLCCVLALLACAAPARALDNGLARTPYMGWNTFLGLRVAFDEKTIRSVAHTMVSDGLARAGYRYVWLDGGWWRGLRDHTGAIRVNRGRWPHGMRSVANYIHSLGLRAGIYTDAGKTGCGHRPNGSWGHYRQDVNEFAAWGFDAVKVDFCGGHRMGLNPAYAYALFRDALAHNSSHRPMLFAVCNPFTPDRFGPGNPSYSRSALGSWSFGPITANSWRTGPDVGFPHRVHFVDVLRNLDLDAARPYAAGPGHWNDPDFLAPQLGMSDVEARTQFAMWAIVAAPLMLSNDIRSMSPANLATFTNRDVIAVDQDQAGVQGTAIAVNGDTQVWVKPLADGTRAIALLNRGREPATIATSAGAAGLPEAASYAVRDLWTHAESTTTGAISAQVAPHDVALFRVGPGG